jgi:hypothetical protein
MNTRSKKTIAVTIGVAAGFAGVLFAGAGPAEAASADQAAAICGSGYYNIDSYGLIKSTIYLEYNGYTDCAVNILLSDHSTPIDINVYLDGPNPSWGGNLDNGSRDSGWYSHYAGPVYTNAPHECIKWGGGDGYMTFNSLLSHCG